MAPSRFRHPAEDTKSGPRTSVRLLIIFALLAIPFAHGAQPPAPIGLQEAVTFAAYTPLAGNAERMRRLLSPLVAWHLQQQLAQANQRLGAQAIDLAREHFTLYVPTRAPPPSGYALLVFVSPWEDAREARQWLPALDRHDTIFVSALDSGNDKDVLNRREPLALLAAYNVIQRYRVDPDRVYVGGFSGGSKVALRLALAYPDLFRGVLLEAGSEPIGSPALPLPPTDLLHRFQQSTRVVYLTGARDDYHQAENARSRESLRDWCVTSVSDVTMPHTQHELADAGSFGRALDELARPGHPDPDKLAKCRVANEQSLQSEILRAKTLLRAGRREEARKVLEQVDAKYGGLAGQRAVALMEQLERAQ